MAETGKNPVAPTPIDTPDESRNASVKVATDWPHVSFTVSSDIPEITSSGTMLTKSQFKAAQESAAASGVSLREVK